MLRKSVAIYCNKNKEEINEIKLISHQTKTREFKKTIHYRKQVNYLANSTTPKTLSKFVVCKLFLQVEALLPCPKEPSNYKVCILLKVDIFKVLM